MVVKQFFCEQCETEGKITIKGNDHQYEDIVYCPLCSSDIYEEEELDDDTEE